MTKPKPKGGGKKAQPKIQQIATNDFTNLVRRCKSLKKHSHEASGEMGELIKNAVENKYLDRVAFQMFRKLESMEDMKLQTTLACLDFYIDIGGLEDRIAKNLGLDLKRQEAGEKEAKAKKPSTAAKPKEAEKEEPPKADNVMHLMAAG